jgi:hypothetical protein
MNAPHATEVSLRLDRFESNRLAWAFGISLAAHLIVWGGYEGGKKLGIWQSLAVPAWLQKMVQAFAPPKAVSVVEPKIGEPPLVFIDVRDSQAEVEPPKNPVGYSDKNSLAASAVPDKDTNLPKLDGSQDKVPRTEDVERRPFDQLKPSRPVETPTDEERAKPETARGDLTMGKPDVRLRPDTGKAERTKPRTLTEARLKNPTSQIPGPKMKQEGGTRRNSLDAGFDVAASPFGAYDRAFIAAVSQRWYDLLEDRVGYQPGRVVVQFRLNYDGRITDVRTIENSTSDLLGFLCQKAIIDPAPYEKWPREMRMQIGEDYRTIKFTFYYN